MMTIKLQKVWHLFSVFLLRSPPVLVRVVVRVGKADPELDSLHGQVLALLRGRHPAFLHKLLGQVSALDPELSHAAEHRLAVGELLGSDAHLDGYVIERRRDPDPAAARSRHEERRPPGVLQGAAGPHHRVEGHRVRLDSPLEHPVVHLFCLLQVSRLAVSPQQAVEGDLIRAAKGPRVKLLEDPGALLRPPLVRKRLHDRGEGHPVRIHLEVHHELEELVRRPLVVVAHGGGDQRVECRRVGLDSPRPHVLQQLQAPHLGPPRPVLGQPRVLVAQAPEQHVVHHNVRLHRAKLLALHLLEEPVGRVHVVPLLDEVVDELGVHVDVRHHPEGLHPVHQVQRLRHSLQIRVHPPDDSLQHGGVHVLLALLPSRPGGQGLLHRLPGPVDPVQGDKGVDERVVSRLCLTHRPGLHATQHGLQALQVTHQAKTLDQDVVAHGGVRSGDTGGRGGGRARALEDLQGLNRSPGGRAGVHAGPHRCAIQLGHTADLPHVPPALVGALLVRVHVPGLQGLGLLEQGVDNPCVVLGRGDHLRLALNGTGPQPPQDLQAVHEVGVRRAAASDDEATGEHHQQGLGKRRDGLHVSQQVL
mmetsp:Transcript_8115/g.29363  ORF Transcript_8115/g.29363 Transcript_8115/m.29363 type:complete len:588 (-) Transcript_8115:552-2315(-)